MSCWVPLVSTAITFQQRRRFGGRPHITVEQFVEFLNNNQRDPRLNEILYPYANPDRARDLFQMYEPADSSRGIRVARADGEQPANSRLLPAPPAEFLSAEGFLRFLLSEDNLIVSPDKFDLSHDMEQPLCHYFINSSHNTYLTGTLRSLRISVQLLSRLFAE